MSDQFEKHLPYELWMLQETLRRFPHLIDQIALNAFIESFCMHARALIEFFQDPKGDKAKLYVKNSYRAFVNDKPRVGDFKDRLNKQIAHLDKGGRFIGTAGKIDDAEMQEMYELLRLEYARFKAELLPEYAAGSPPDPLPVERLVVPTVPPSTTNAILGVSSGSRTTSANATHYVVDTGKKSK